MGFIHNKYIEITTVGYIIFSLKLKFYFKNH